MLICLSLFAVIVIAVLSIDAIPVFRTWVQRIHIGRYPDSKHWIKNMVSIVGQWLGRIPVTPLGDNRRLTIIDRFSGHYQNNTLQSWQEAALLLGAGRYLVDHPTDDRVKHAVLQWIDQKFNKDGTWKSLPQEVDEVMLCSAIMQLPCIDRLQYRPALEQVRDFLFAMKQEDGTIPYRRFQKKIRYVDTVGFICPFLVAYGCEFKDEEAIDLAFQQILSFSKNAMLPETQIPAHAFDLERSVPLGIYGWGRGIAWYALGLMGMLEHLPPNDKRRDELLSLAKILSENLLQYQQQNGGWAAMVTLADSPTDSSATSVLGRFLLRIGKELDRFTYLDGAERSLTYLKSVTRKSGIVDFSQGDTKGIGRYSSRYEQMPFTQGMTLLFAMESQEKVKV